MCDNIFAVLLCYFATRTRIMWNTACIHAFLEGSQVCSCCITMEEYTLHAACVFKPLLRRFLNLMTAGKHWGIKSNWDNLWFWNVKHINILVCLREFGFKKWTIGKRGWIGVFRMPQWNWSHCQQLSESLFGVTSPDQCKNTFTRLVLSNNVAVWPQMCPQCCLTLEMLPFQPFPF